MTVIKDFLTGLICVGILVGSFLFTDWAMGKTPPAWLGWTFLVIVGGALTYLTGAWLNGRFEVKDDD